MTCVLEDSWERPRCFDSGNGNSFREAGGALQVAAPVSPAILPILCFLVVLSLLLIPATSFSQIQITNNSLLTTWSDSFARAQYGSRQNFYLLSHYINKYPQFVISPRDHSRSGGDNLEMCTQRFPEYGVPEWGATQGKTNVIDFLYVSSNGAYTSNQIYGYFNQLVQAPSVTYNRAGQFTNDWTQSTNLFQKVIIGDIAYRTETGDPASRDRSYGARTVAEANGIPWVDSWTNLVNIVTNQFVQNPNAYWFNAPNYDHPGNELQFIWAMDILKDLREDTNIYSCAIDFNGATVNSTNHCTASNLLLSQGTLTFTFHADRMGPAYDVPSPSQTNDCTGAFPLQPSLSNAFCETIQITNMPVGNYNVFLDNSNIATVSSAQLAEGLNLFTVYKGAFWAQKCAGLALLRGLVNISPTNVSEYYQPNGNTFIIRQESYASTVWPTNNTGVDGYIAQSDMVARESELQAEDQVIHAAAQQTNHIFTIAPMGQTITFPSPGDQTYGASLLTLTATASSGLPIVYTVISGPATVSSNTLTITGAGAVTIEADQPGNADWPPATPVTQTISIAQKTLVPHITANNKLYDGTSSATVASRTITGIVGTDVVALTGGTAAFPDKTAGTARLVTATDLSLTGPDAGNYILSSTTATATADITPLGLTVTGVTAVDRIYNGTITVTVATDGASLVGIIGADAVTLGGTAIGTFADGNVGAGKTVTISGLTLGGVDAGNYQLTQPTATATITKAATSNALTSSRNPVRPGRSLTFTSVTTAVPPGGGTPTGIVVFKNGTTCLSTNALDGSATASFITNGLAHGSNTIIAEYPGDANFCGSTNSLIQVIDTPPVASSTNLGRYAASGVKVRSSTLLAADTDADGDALKLTSVSATSAFGGTIITNGDWICYQPPAGFTNSDTFSYVIADSFGLQSTGSVSVVVLTDTNAPQNYAPGGGFGQNLATLRFAGIPGRVYTIQYTTNTIIQGWKKLGTATASSRGLILYFDSPPTNSPPRTYRTTYP